MIYRDEIQVTGAAGSDGVATASGFSSRGICGTICAVHVAYIGSPPGTTDVTIAEANNSPAVTVLTLTNANTDGWFYPVAQADTPAGSAISAEYIKLAVADTIEVTIAGANADDGCTVTILYEGK